MAEKALNSNKKKIISLSQFNANSEGHGGEKRTAQIREILQTYKIEEDFVNRLSYNLVYPKFFSINKFQALYTGYKSLHNSPFIKFHESWEKVRESSSILGHRQLYSKAFNPYQLFLVELGRDTDWKDIILSKNKGLKIIALPHNLESLVPSQISPLSGKSSPDWLDEEISLLKLCDKVFTIAREDQWLLRTHGVDADYLPYYPTEAYVNILIGIREKRQQSRKEAVLMMGSASNQPTFEGFKDRISLLNKDQIDVNIIGFQTEQLKKFITADNRRIKVFGSVKQEELIHYYINARCILVHQSPSSGALTRITESLIAGIPVVANVNAARSFFHVDGIHIYETEEEMLSLLKSDLSIPKIPPRPKQAEKRFINVLK